MPRRRRSRKNQADNIEVLETDDVEAEVNQIREEIAEKTKLALITVASVLVIGLLILIFRVGESMYPVWVIEYRNLIIGILLSITIVVILISPLIIEANSNPRPLSGPGKRPMGT